jgi:hypothetical protein
MESSTLKCAIGDVSAVRGPSFGLLRNVASTALLGLALLSASGAALAGIPGIDASLASLVSGPAGTKEISYSTAGSTYHSAYKVRIANPGGNVNRIFFTAVTSVIDPGTSLPTGLTAPFVVPVAGCTPAPSSNNTRLDCEFGPLPAGSAPIEFIVLVSSPVGTPSQPDSKLAVSWTIQAGQGQANPSNLVYDVAELVTLKVGSPTEGVRSFVLANTVLGVADPSLGDASTNITPPAPVTVGVKQYISTGGSCSADYKQCLQSAVSIVDNAGKPISFDPAAPLAIDLFRPVTTLNKGANIRNAVLSYSPDGLAAALPIIDCNRVGSSWQIPAVISGAYAQDRCVVPSKPVNKLTFADKLGWHIRIFAKSNGLIDW